MDAEAIYQDQDRYAKAVSGILAEHGLVDEEEAREVKRFLRGW